MKIEFKKIFEHDMDLLIMEEFVADHAFAQLFLNKVGLTGDYTLVRTSHSLSDADGESDITFVLRYADRTVALLIEDKIDAPTMDRQSQRYHKRGETGKQAGEYDTYFVMLAAPAEYHYEHRNDINADYPYTITYEEMRNYLAERDDPHSAFKAAVIDFTLREKKAGYQVQEVKAVTKFWQDLRRFCKEQYPWLEMVGQDTPKGGAAAWPEFRTTLGTAKVIYKSQRGCVDLELSGYGERIGDLNRILDGKLTDSAQICKTGKSASVRIADERWKMDFSQEFEEYRSVVQEVLQAVSQLCELASQLNYSDLY